MLESQPLLLTRLQTDTGADRFGNSGQETRSNESGLPQTSRVGRATAA